MISLDFLWHLVSVLIPAIAVYVGIRTDQAVMRVKIERACETAARCHERLDDHLANHLFK